MKDGEGVVMCRKCNVLQAILVDTVKSFIASNWTDMPENVIAVERVLEHISAAKGNGLIRWIGNHTSPDGWRGYYLDRE